MDFGLRLIFGVLGGAGVAYAAFRARSLTAGGSVVAALTGAAAVAAGWSWAALLLAYFISSTLLSRAGRAKKQERTAGMIEKPGPRDARQVLANGFVFLGAAWASAFDLGSTESWMAIAAGSLAASAADTWATEVGTLVGGTPRSILTWQPLAIGQSGGVSLAGSIAALQGAAFIGIVLVVAGWPSGMPAAAAAGGVAGAFADSVIGATLQQRRWCDVCDKPTEMRIHRCGGRSRRLGGVAFIENDAVNLTATAIGAATAAIVYRGWS